MSFDGKAQDIQRKNESSKKLISSIKELLNNPNINLEVNSAFTPATIDLLAESMEFIMVLEVPNIHFSLSPNEHWSENSLQKFENEMKKLRKITLHRYERKGDIPIVNLREIDEKGIFFARLEGIAITPEESVWGYFLFPEYFKGKEGLAEYQKFYFGYLDYFIKYYENIYPRILSSYKHLSMYNFYTSKMKCFLYLEITNCVLCPIISSFSSANLFEIQEYFCRIQKIKTNTIKKFREEKKITTINIL